MTIYHELAYLIMEHQLSVISKPVYDERTGIEGEHLYVKSRYGFLNKRGRYSQDIEPDTIDLSVNGFCFSGLFLEPILRQVESFYGYRGVQTFDDFASFIKTRKFNL